MFSHTKRHYCKFFVYWKYSLEDGTYFAKEDSDEKHRRRGACSYERIFACECKNDRSDFKRNTLLNQICFLKKCARIKRWINI